MKSKLLPRRFESASTFGPDRSSRRGAVRRTLVAGLCAAMASSGCFFDLGRSNALGPGEVGGQSVRPDGDPAAFAALGIDGLSIRSTARADGVFRLTAPEGSWRLTAKEDEDGDGWPERAAVVGFRVVNTSVSAGLFGTQADQLSSIDLGHVVLDGTLRLEGEATNVDATPASDARIVIVHDAVPIAGLVDEVVASNGAVEARVAAGADGEFVVPAIAAGTFVVLAYAERNGEFFISAPRTISQRSGDVILRGADGLVLERSDAEREIVFDVVPPPAANARVEMRLSTAGGLSPETVTRTATARNGRFVVPAVPVGPWAVKVTVDELSVSRLEMRFVFPGNDAQDIGAIRVDDGSCENCDCDADGIRGLPPHPEFGERGGLCDVTNFALVWELCSDTCARSDRGAPLVCAVNGVVFDCEDDLDGQQDVDEPRCYGIDKGGVDCDGDGLCDAFDSDDRCAAGRTCEASDVNLCVGGVVNVPPTDGGPVDAGEDAGDVDAGFDAGPPDGGPIDAGLPDGGPFDAGLPDGGPVDAGDIDGGLPDAGPFDAGTLELPPSFTGDLVSEAVPEWSLDDAIPMFFSGTLMRLQSFGFGNPPATACTFEQFPAGQTNEALLLIADDGTCVWKAGLIMLGEIESIRLAPAPDGQVFAVTEVTSDITVGLDTGGTPVSFSPTAGEGPLFALWRYGTDGAINAARTFSGPPEMSVFRLRITSHPLAQGPVVVMEVGGGDVPVAFGFDTVSTLLPLNGILTVFFDETLSATDLVPSGESEGSLEFVVAPSPHRVLIAGGSPGGTLFQGTPAEILAGEGDAYLAEVRPEGFAWSRLLPGLNTEVAFGVDVVEEDAYLAFELQSDARALLVADAQGLIAFDPDTEAVLPVAVPASGLEAFAVGPNVGDVIYPDNTSLPRTLHRFNRHSRVDEVVLTSGDDETFEQVEVTNGTLVVLDSYGTLQSLNVGGSATQIDFGVSAFAVSGDDVYFLKSGELFLARLFDPSPAQSTALVFNASLLTLSGSTLVTYTEIGGNSEFQILPTNPLPTSTPPPFLSVPGTLSATDLAYEESTGTLWVSTLGGVLSATGVDTATVPGSVALASVPNTSTSPTGIALQNESTLALTDALGNTDPATGNGKIHIFRIGSDGALLSDDAIGFGPGEFSPDALSVHDGHIALGGKITGGALRFDTATATPVAVTNADATATEFAENTDLEIAAIRFTRDTTTGRLFADWGRQTESDRIDRERVLAFADATVAIAAETQGEIRLGTVVATATMDPLAVPSAVHVWRIGADGGQDLLPSTRAPIVDTAPLVGVAAGPVILSKVTLLTNGYVVEGRAQSGTLIFAGTDCEYTPPSGAARLVYKVSNAGQCEWIRAYSEPTVTNVATGVGDHIILALNAGPADIIEFFKRGATEITTDLVGNGPGFVAQQIADDGTRLASVVVEGSVANPSEVFAVSFPKDAPGVAGSFGLASSTDGAYTVFPSTLAATTVATPVPERIRGFVVVADFSGTPLFWHPLDGDDDAAVSGVAGLADGSIVFAAEVFSAGVPGATNFDGGVTLNTFSATVVGRYRPDFVDVVSGTFAWFNQIENVFPVTGVVTTPGATQFALCVSYTNDIVIGGTFGGIPLDPLNEANVVAVIAGESRDGTLVAHGAVHTFDADDVSLTMSARGQLSFSTVDDGPQRYVHFYPNGDPNSFTTVNPLTSRIGTIWRLAIDPSTNEMGLASTQTFEDPTSNMNLNLASRAFLEDVAVIKGDPINPPFDQGTGDPVAVTEVGFPVLVRLPSHLILK